MQQWLYAHTGKELAEVVASFFSNVPQELLVRSLQRYLDAGLWARDPAMSKQGFETPRLELPFRWRLEALTGF